jgi:hypothetical protein
MMKESKQADSAQPARFYFYVVFCLAFFCNSP